MKLETGWLARDVERAAKRAAEFRAEENPPMKLETSEEERASKFAEAIKRVGQLPDLPDSIRLPLHSLKADTRYLTGRVAIEGESIKAHVDDSILTRLSQIETAVYGILAERAPPLPAEETVARCVEAVRREYPASVSEPYPGTPAIIIDAGEKPVELDDLVRIVLAAAPPAPPLPAEVERVRQKLDDLVEHAPDNDALVFHRGLIAVAASLLSRWPGVWRPIESLTPQHGMRALTFGRLHDDGGVDMGECPAIQMSTYDRDSGWSSAEWGGHKPTHIYLLPEPPHE